MSSVAVWQNKSKTYLFEKLYLDRSILNIDLLNIYNTYNYLHNLNCSNSKNITFWDFVEKYLITEKAKYLPFYKIKKIHNFFVFCINKLKWERVTNSFLKTILFSLNKFTLFFCFPSFLFSFQLFFFSFT